MQHQIMASRFGDNDDDDDTSSTSRRRRRLLRVPAALAVALVGTSMSVGTAINGCTPSDPPRPDAGQASNVQVDGGGGSGDDGGGVDAGSIIDGSGNVADAYVPPPDAYVPPPDAPKPIDAYVPPPDAPHT
ncbi:MAG TPA: hypothetical protein VL326_28120 [Kofleriaceae bacterium]|nr:hypothetical protein [Kofleriaceae bacterium]